METVHIKVVIFIILINIQEYESFDYCEYEPLWEPQGKTMLAPFLNFMWLGLLQYLHIETENIYPYKMPRVILIHKNYVLLPAKDAVEIPEGYALGNVVFPEYEREEKECGLTSPKDLRSGHTCDAVTVIMPILDVSVHPEYPENAYSIALLKLIRPIKSTMVLPVCLPFKAMEDMGSNPNAVNYIIDFSVGVTRDYAFENKYIVKTGFMPSEYCKMQANKMNASKSFSEKLTCSNVCNFYTGAPVVSRHMEAHYILDAIAVERVTCADPIRRKYKPPTFFIKIFPYLKWIRPQLFVTAEVISPALRKGGKNKYIWANDPVWIGHYHQYGHCLIKIHQMRLFYREMFSVHTMAEELSYLTWNLVLLSSVSKDSTKCMRIGVPFRRMQLYVSKRPTPEKLQVILEEIDVYGPVKWVILAYKHDS